MRAGLSCCANLAAVFGATLVLSAIASAQQPDYALFIMRPDGSDVRQIARVEGLPDHEAPRWSHDGKQIAFEAAVDANTNRFIYVVNADGTGLRQFAQHAKPDWSPDDKQLVYQNYGGGEPKVYVQNLDGQGRSQLSTGRSARWSPDGSKLALSNIKMLRLMDLTSGEDEPLFDEEVAEISSGFDWSPDGKRLVVVVRKQPNEKRELRLVNADPAAKGYTVRLLTGAGGCVSWSPDGKQIVLSDNYLIQIVDVEGNKPPKIIPGQKGKNRSPCWSPDGKWIVFGSDRK